MYIIKKTGRYWCFLLTNCYIFENVFYDIINFIANAV